jgi:Putative phage serine protease XkdF
MNKTTSDVKVKKSVNEELKQALFVVLEPGVVDAHGDIYNADEIRKAKESFNRTCMRANILHLVNNTDSFSIEESYIAPSDMIINNQAVLKGSWLCNLQFKDEDIWQGVKDGTFNGVSIGAKARTEYLE